LLTNKKPRGTNTHLAPPPGACMDIFKFIIKLPRRAVSNLYDMLTFTGEALALIFPQETASSGRAPESLPSYSDAVFK